MNISNVSDYMNTTPSDMWQNCTVGGECSQCGQCCGNLLPVSNKEIKRIKAYIKSHGVKESKKIFPLANRTIDLTCPFLDETKHEEKCSIYPVRPAVCRAYRCDKSQWDMLSGMDLREDYMPISMRDTFFGKGE